jgi:hypothetical protein
MIADDDSDHWVDEWGMNDVPAIAVGAFLVLMHTL